LHFTYYKNFFLALTACTWDQIVVYFFESTQ
jgi:hypothetical protein